MNLFLDEYIKSLSGSAQKTVNSVLNESRVSKTQIDKVAEMLTSFSGRQSIPMSPEKENSLIEVGKYYSNFGIINTSIKELFKQSLLISLVMDSYVDILSSEIMALNKDLDTIEKNLKNYAFLLSDSRAYDYAFLEPFSDYRTTDHLPFNIPDRGGSFFAGSEMASINLEDGTLVMGKDLNKRYSMTGIVTDNNYAASEHFDNGIANALTKDPTKAWKITVKSQTPINSSLPVFNDLYGTTQSGVLLAAELTLPQPAPCDTFVIDPAAGYELELLQIVVFYDNNRGGASKKLLSRPHKITGKSTFHFPMQAVKSVKIYIRQGAYTKTFTTSKTPTQAVIERRVPANIDGKLGFFASPWASPIHTPRTALTTAQNEPAWSTAPALHQVLYDSLRAMGVEDDGWMHIREVVSIFEDNHDLDAAIYQYDIGIKNFSIGASVDNFKGVYVSVPLDSPGDIGEIRLKSEYDNFEDLDLQNPLLTSVEFSISNKATPKNESDWIPLMPVGEEEVKSERLIPNELGTAMLRFPASTADGISVFKNGLPFPVDPIGEYVRTDNGTVIGIKLNRGSFTSQDFLTCKYTPLGDNSTINFENKGFGSPLLVGAFDNQGAGERFESTSNQIYVKLANTPFINIREVAKSTYSETTGTTPYQPITVRTLSGKTFINLTDYANPGNKISLDSTLSDISYIQSGNMIIFNKEVNEPFRVFYEYVPNNTRIRVVLRCNSKSFTTPKVDYYQIKAKTRIPEINKLI